MTAISVMQCVERGQFTLDEDVTRLLPELSGIEILEGFEGGTEKPILVKPTNKLNLR
jgi:CubicO group peptidase (beta-lactamase class C family)